MNPSSTPTEPSPYGLETIASYIRPGAQIWSPQFSLIKGFQKFGSGVSTASNNTFYGNDVLLRAEGHSNLSSFKPEEPKSSLPNVNFGTSFDLNPDKKGKITALKLGTTLRHNKTTNTQGGGLGFTIGNSVLKFGSGLTREKVSNKYPAMYFSTFMMSTKLLFLELEYTGLKSFEGPYLPFIHIITGTLNFGKILLTTAARRVSYFLDGDVIQKHFGIQVSLGSAITLGYLYNYIPGTSSIALQYYF